MPEFERSNPGIRVKVQQLPWTAAHEKLLTAFAGDVTPDICQLGNTWVPELVALDALVPLDRYVASPPIVDAADYFAGIWETNRIGGRLYGVPWYVDTRLVFYRRDLLSDAGFSAPPQSWQAVDADAGRHRATVTSGSARHLAATQRGRAAPGPCSATGRAAPAGRWRGATSGAPASIARWRSISRCSSAAGPPWSRTRRSRTCGTGSAAAGSCSTCRGPGPSASCSGGCRPTSSRAGRRRRYPDPTGRAHRSRAAPAWCCFARHATRRRRGASSNSCRNRPCSGSSMR